MKKLIVASLLLALPFIAKAKEPCTLESIGLTENSPIPEQLFYTGTCHYRNEYFAKAVTPWIQLAKLKNVDSSHVDLQIDTLNNLGYMMFFGYGIDMDQRKALSYWKKAVSLGHTESEYHLCHAYADKKYPTFNPLNAKPHCKKALLIYQEIKSRSQDEETILSQINEYSRIIGN